MKKIGIDARLYFQTGVGVYLRNLLYYLDKKAPKKLEIIAYVLSKDANKITRTYKNIKIRKVNSKWHTVSEQFSFLFELLKDDLDLMHFTYFSFPVFYHKDYISTIHDTTLLKYKTGKASTKSLFIYNLKHAVFRYIFSKQVKNSKKIITPTKSVKKQIMKIINGVDEHKIVPIYEGVTHEYLKLKQTKNTKKIFEDYFLYVGTFYPHKNVENLLRAYAKIKTSIKLYLIGPDDYFSKGIEKLVEDLNLKEKVKVFKNVPQNKLPEYYKYATALIHPSLSEGFGLPIIEAAFFGLPIIASDIDVFTEILGNNYLSFDPNDINDIKNKVEIFIKKRPIFDYKNLLKQFSFEKMSKRTLKLYLEASAC